MAATVKNLVYMVTGAASGMGLATGQLMLQKGARLALCDINQDALKQSLSSLSEDEKQRNEAAFQQLDGIANFAGNAGHALGRQLLWETDDKEYDFIMDCNVRGLFNILRTSLKPGFLSQPSSLVHITSMYAERGFQNAAVFTASKHAANGMVKSAAMEVAHRGIRINSIMPGVIDTPGLRAGRKFADIPPADVPMGRFGLAEEVAKVTAFLLSEEANYVTGSHWAVDGGANAVGKHQ